MLTQQIKFTKKHFLIVGALLHIIAAYFSYGAHHPDELFQVFEFAGYKLGLNQASDLPWEFHEKMRSGIEPLLIYVCTKAAQLFSVYNPFTIAFFLRTVVSLFSFYALFILLNFFEKEISSLHLKSHLWFLGCCFSFLPYFHARLSSENFSSTLFIFGLIFGLKNFRSDRVSFKLIGSGFLLGLAFLCRFQMSFMIAGFLGWLLFIKKVELKNVFAMLIGSLMALGFGLLVDHWLYAQWTLSWWNYLDLNLFKHAASQFGEQPFYFYFLETISKLLPPFSILFILLLFVFWYKYKTHVLTWISFPFIILHFFIGHKELRFLFPILDFLPLITVLSYSALQSEGGKFYRFITNRWLTRLFVLVNVGALLVFSLLPADYVTQVLKKMYDLSEDQKAILIYKDQNPYNNQGSLNYFKNPNLISLEAANVNDSLIKTGEVYYYFEGLLVSDSIRMNKNTYYKQYANFPWWFVYLNYNQWIEKAGFSIYKKETKD